jgi:hypothetical protein
MFPQEPLHSANVKKENKHTLHSNLHLAAKHFVKAMAPTSPTSIQKKVKAALTKAWDEGQLDLDQFNEALAALAPDDGDNNNEIEFTPGDSWKGTCTCQVGTIPTMIFNLH